MRTHRMGICGTDTSAFNGTFPFFHFPCIPGHELGVEAISVGENVFNVKVGDRCFLQRYFNNPGYNPHLRQLLHVGFKIAAELGETYLDASKNNSATVEKIVTANLQDRHIAQLF